MFLGCPKCKYFTNKMSDYRRHQFFHHIEERKRKCYYQYNMKNHTCEQSTSNNDTPESEYVCIDKS
jgi:hypothetical protein